jgi:predicted membrane protein DUF2306
MHISLVLLLHICAGTIGLLSGAVAISFRKGSRRHAMAGKVFVISMLGLSSSAVYLALMRHEIGNFIGGVLTFYLVTTAWFTVRRRDGETSVLDWAALLVPLAVGVTNVTYGIEKVNDPTGFHDGVPAGMNFFLGAVVLLAAAGDVRMLVRGLSATQRIARHLWRMCFALFIASGSIFIARPQLFPAFLRKTNILLLLGILPLMLLIFWIIRIRFTKAYRVGLFLGDRVPTRRPWGLPPTRGQSNLERRQPRTSTG